jgi:ABC-type polysaccharide/polyol phosphate export permease
MMRAGFLIGKIPFNCLLSLVQACITVPLRTVLLAIPLRWEYFILILAGIVLGTAGWFFFLSSFAFFMDRDEVFNNTFINVSYFVLMFASSLFYPVDTLPSWLKIIAYLNPLIRRTDVLRFATIAIGSLAGITWEAAAFILFLILSSAHAAQHLRRAVIR